MIGTIEFIQCAGSLTTAECPIIAADSELDDYVKATYQNVHFTEDTQQDITMPAFDGWSNCNIVRLKNNEGTWTAYYWIAQTARSSDTKGANVYSLTFNPLLTLTKKGDVLTGDWLKSPVNYTPWKQQAIVSGTMGYKRPKSGSRSKKFVGDNMPIDTKETAWVSVTASKNPTSEQGTYEIYGFPVYCGELGDIYGASNTVTAPNGEYPSLGDIFHGNSLARMGLTTSEILDISITRFAVYDYDLTDHVFALKNLAGSTLKPTKVTYNDGTADVESECVMYNLTDDDYIQYQVSRHVKNDSIYLTDTELGCGQLNIIKGDGTIIKNIPTSWAEGHYIYYKSEIIADFGQMVMLVTITDSDGDPKDRFVIPCNHIPYIGNQWDLYRAYDMVYDREALEFGIDQSRDAMYMNMALSIVDTSIDIGTQAVSFAANPGATAADQVANTMSGVSSGSHLVTKLVSEVYSQYQKEKSSRFNQKLKERRTQAQPGNAINISYGVAHVYMELENNWQFIVSLPDQLTDTIYEQFIEDFGYANEGRYDMPITYGFYQGTVFSTPTLTGPRYAELINAFNNGIRLIPPGGRI